MPIPFRPALYAHDENMSRPRESDACCAMFPRALPSSNHDAKILLAIHFWREFMKKLLLFLAISSLCLQVNAAETDQCTRACATDKKDCRSDTDANVRDYGTKELVSSEKRPTTAETDADTFLNNRQDMASAKLKIREDGYRACETSYRQCSKLCPGDQPKSEK